MQQLAIPLPDQVTDDASTFIVGSANQEAWEWLLSLPYWPLAQVVIKGPKGSGKTHLAHAVAQLRGGVVITPQAQENPLNLVRSSKIILVDDYDQFKDESWLFHLYNLAKEHNCQVAYFGEVSPSHYNFSLNDLASRLRSLPCLDIHEPDDDLFRQLFRKELQKRGMICSDDIIEYIYRRFDRSYATIHHLVEIINDVTLVQQRSLTLPLLKEIFP